MTGSDKPQAKKPNPPRKMANQPRTPLQVMHISRKAGELPNSGSSEENAQQTDKRDLKSEISSKEPNRNFSSTGPQKPQSRINSEEIEILEQGLTMDDLLNKSGPKDISNYQKGTLPESNLSPQSLTRSVDDFDFDEDAFLAALNENEPIGNKGEITSGAVIGVESDGIYVDIGGKAPGFMPKSECGLGVITNLKERFPKGLEVQVLVTGEQNADGMVTISARALALRQSWKRVQDLEKEGKVVKTKINGFNRGGVTCDLEGLRGFIPRSQLESGENHEKLVGKIIQVSFLEVNPETRKLVLSEKKASVAARFNELQIGNLIEGKVLAIKPYGYFIDIGGVSGLLHHSMTTNGSIRSLREIFQQGETIKAIITDLDAKRGRIGLNTALLEGPPGELLTDKEKVMSEADERAIKARNTINQEKVKNESIQEVPGSQVGEKKVNEDDSEGRIKNNAN